jgi:hypothetical protein
MPRCGENVDSRFKGGVGGYPLATQAAPFNRTPPRGPRAAAHPQGGFSRELLSIRRRSDGHFIEGRRMGNVWPGGSVRTVPGINPT